MNKICAIYNIFDGVELLNGSIDLIYDHVDQIIIIHQSVSNFGEDCDVILTNQVFLDMLDGENKIQFVRYDPIGKNGVSNETAKRQLGIETLLSEFDCTHFFHIDVDEYYPDFRELKEEYFASGASGSVCKIFTYFKKPTLRFEREDEYYVPFIHKLKPDTTMGVKNNYPFYVDPTRRVNETDVRMLNSGHMHHFSWVRKNIEMKVRNSSAGEQRIRKTTLLQDYYSEDTGPGSLIKDYHNMRLIEVPNRFNINI